MIVASRDSIYYHVSYENELSYDIDEDSMKDVAVTGMGLISPLGRGMDEQIQGLRAGRSGIVGRPEWAEQGLRSQVAGNCPWEPYKSEFSRKELRFMSAPAVLAGAAATDAIKDSGLSPEEVGSERTSIFAGTGGGASILDAYELGKSIYGKGAAKTLPYYVPLAMGSMITANLSVIHKMRGASYGITSACTTSLHAIAHGLDHIRLGRSDIVFAGGAEDVNVVSAGSFDAMRALSSAFNHTPEKASRPLDRARDGFVFSGGGGFLILEDAERAKARGARIHAIVAGASSTSDGADMVAPSGEGAGRAMRGALEDAGASTKDVQYINLHGTSTPAGDLREVEAIVDIFGSDPPAFSSTKSMTGHGLGVAGVMEAIFSILAIQENFLPPNINLDDPEPFVEDLPVVREARDADVRGAIANSFGFGGTNCSVFFAAP